MAEIIPPYDPLQGAGNHVGVEFLPVLVLYLHLFAASVGLMPGALGEDRTLDQGVCLRVVGFTLCRNPLSHCGLVDFYILINL